MHAVYILSVYIHYIWLIRFGCECTETVPKCLDLFKVVLSSCCVNTAVYCKREILFPYSVPLLCCIHLSSYFFILCFLGQEMHCDFQTSNHPFATICYKYRNAESQGFLALCSIINSLEFFLTVIHNHIMFFSLS